MVDNQVLYHAWLREGCKNKGVNKALKSILDVTASKHRAVITVATEWSQPGGPVLEDVVRWRYHGLATIVGTY